jgi:hypothetical protein
MCASCGLSFYSQVGNGTAAANSQVKGANWMWIRRRWDGMFEYGHIRRDFVEARSSSRNLVGPLVLGGWI